MQFNPTDKSISICADIDFWITGRGDVSSDCPIEDKTRLANAALDRICYLILRSDNKWNWDDANQTNLPIRTTDLVENQRDYGIPQTEFLKVLKVLVKDRAGNYRELEPVSLHSPEGQRIAENRDTDQGTPQYYVKLGSSVFLGPKPDYSSTDGVKIFYQRNIHYFTTSDTTAQPGFNPNFHRLVPLYAARDYCAANGLFNRLPILDKEIAKYEAALIDFFSSRAEDQPDRLRLRKEDYGATELTDLGTEEQSVDWQHET